MMPMQTLFGATAAGKPVNLTSGFSDRTPAAGRRG
jgi:hypothetical protein